MQFINAFLLLCLAGFSACHPIYSRSLDVAISNTTTNSTTTNSTTTNSNTTNSNTTSPDAPILDITNLNDNAAAALAPKKPTAAQVKNAVSSFANDANTVSSSLNTLATTTDTKMIKSLATTAFNAESDEDQQRAVLAAAAGSAGTSPNKLIMKFTPTVLTGLKNMMQTPTTAAVKKNVATIANARNPNILPSITSLSNSALKTMGLAQTAQKFPATNQ